MEPKIQRVLTKFRHNAEDYEGKIDITNVPLATLRQIFPNPEDPMLYLSYRVDREHATALQPHVAELLDLGRHDYFLDAASDP